MSEESQMPIFPIFNLSFGSWDSIFLDSIFVEDHYYYGNSNKKFLKEDMGTRWIDSQGNIFILSGKESMSKWRALVPLMAKAKMLFTATGEKMTLAEMKAYMLDKVAEIPVHDAAFTATWREQIISADSFEKLYYGQ